ncbi:MULTISPECIES: transcriptional regulator PpsR [Hyphomicrobiales]|jgi:transcriptional regulator PpsR|uniref:Transcriptional regulator PpsR n=2 Tax=Bacteria TaxID=2 RepID=A0ABW0NX49_9HYPH|nr:transcriptional regulator PpsR [Methylobacterium sp. CCH7-A2]
MDVFAPQTPTLGFKGQSGWLGRLAPETAGSLITASSDIALVLDREGVIVDVSLGTPELRREDCRSWIGRPWTEVVSVESRPKVQDLLKGAADEAAIQFRELNHPLPGGTDLPVRYSAMQVGQDGTIVALGRDLRNLAHLQQQLVEAQQAMEREYARLRMAETRYRMLFHLTSEPVVIVEATQLRVVEANPAAQQHLELPADKLTNTSILAGLAPESGEALQGMLRTVQATGRADETEIALASGGKRFRALASAFRQDQAGYLLIRLTPLAGEGSAGSGFESRILGLLEHLPDGFVVISPELKILEANRAFLDLAQLSSKHQALGEPLDMWLGRPGIDLQLLMVTLTEHGVVRNFNTIVRGQFGTVEEVEISAVPALSGSTPSYGFVIRSLGVRNALAGQRGRGLPRSVEHLTELVGRVSLRELVRETTDVIEKLCIEAALELSKDNRASAANMLGLSRQSFYAKLRRHGLGDLDDGEDDGSDLN